MDLSRTATTPAVVPSLRGTTLGKFAMSDDRSECETEWSHDVLAVGGRRGSKNGYESVDTAIEALKALTLDTMDDSAVVMKQGDRFYGYKLLVEGSRYSPDFDTREDYYVNFYAPKDVDPRLVAFVDGDYAASPH